MMAIVLASDQFSISAAKVGLGQVSRDNTFRYARIAIAPSMNVL